MRMHGTVDSARGLVPTGHLCWAFTSRSEFRSRAVEYLRDGLAHGQWIEYVGSGSSAGLRAELAEVDGLGPALEAGIITVTPVEDFYVLQPDNATVDPSAAVKARIAATEQAAGARFRGRRGSLGEFASGDGCYAARPATVARPQDDARAGPRIPPRLRVHRSRGLSRSALTSV